MTTVITKELKESVEREIVEQRYKLALQYTRLFRWIAVGFTVGLYALWLAFREYPQLLIIAIAGTFVTISATAVFWFHRKGRTETGIQLFLANILLALLIAYLFAPAIFLAVVTAAYLVDVFAQQFLGAKKGFWLVVASIAGVSVDLVLVILVIPHWSLVKPMPDSVNIPLQLLVGIPVMIIFALILRGILLGNESNALDLRMVSVENDQRAQNERLRRNEMEKNVEQYVQMMKLVSQGDLSLRLALEHLSKDDPLSLLGAGVNEMIASQQELIRQIQEAVSNLTSASAEILAGSTQQTSGSSQQSAAITQTTSTVEEVKTISEQVIERSQEVANAALQSVEITRSGERMVSETVRSMVQIKMQVSSIAENILALVERTQQIGEIISSVNEIASQSNILALNAAVEAARAGEHGKGFAVVAAEVRNLASQSRQATLQVRTILTDIQKAINTTVIVTEEGTKLVDKGVELAEESGKSIQQLGGVIDEASLMATQMVAGGKQQATGIEQIAAAMQNIKLATIQGLESTRQMEKAAQDMTQLARRLLENISTNHKDGGG